MDIITFLSYYFTELVKINLLLQSLYAIYIWLSRVTNAPSWHATGALPVGRGPANLAPFQEEIQIRGQQTADERHLFIEWFKTAAFSADDRGDNALNLRAFVSRATNMQCQNKFTSVLQHYRSIALSLQCYSTTDP